MNGMILAQPRMYYAMAEEGHFFKCFAKIHPKYKVPYAPIIVQGVLSVILVLIRNLDQLTNLVVVSAMVFNVLVVLAVPILRKKYPNIERPYKVWFYPVSVIITALIFCSSRSKFGIRRSCSRTYRFRSTGIWSFGILHI